MGCKAIINHRDCDRILRELVEALGADKAGNDQILLILFCQGYDLLIAFIDFDIQEEV